VEYAGSYAFAGCAALTNITFEEKLAGQNGYTLGEHFFDGCTAMTELNLPKGMTVLSAYMFANSGIVNAVIPAGITDLNVEGVFYNCTQLETVVFENYVLDCQSLGERFFYGCTKIKELTIPYGVDYPCFNKEEYAGCTSLEKITFHPVFGVILYESSFAGCANLKTLECYNVDEFEYDEDENVVGYAEVSKCGPYSLEGSPFRGNTSIKFIEIGDLYVGEAYLYGDVFAGSAIETVVVNGGWYMEIGTNEKCGRKGTFSGASALKEVWIIGEEDCYPWLDPETFRDLDHDVNFYFVSFTKDYLIDCVGDDEWLTSASEYAHFYFADTMPEGAEIPKGAK
jgi:hypothetical protein